MRPSFEAVGLEGFLERRAYEFQQGFVRRNGLAQGFQGVPGTVQNTCLGVGQSAVQVKKDIAIHSFSPFFLKSLPYFLAFRKAGGEKSLLGNVLLDDSFSDFSKSALIRIGSPCYNRLSKPGFEKLYCISVRYP